MHMPIIIMYILACNTLLKVQSVDDFQNTCMSLDVSLVISKTHNYKLLFIIMLMNGVFIFHSASGKKDVTLRNVTKSVG